MLSTTDLRNRKNVNHHQAFEKQTTLPKEKQVDDYCYIVLSISDAGSKTPYGYIAECVAIIFDETIPNQKYKFKLAYRKEFEQTLKVSSPQLLFRWRNGPLEELYEMNRSTSWLFFKSLNFLMIEEQKATQLVNDDIWETNELTIGNIPYKFYDSFCVSLQHSKEEQVKDGYCLLKLILHPDIEREESLTNYSTILLSLGTHLTIPGYKIEKSKCCMKNNIALRHLQMISENMEIWECSKAWAKKFKTKIFRKDYFKRRLLKEPQYLLPIFYLFGLRDMKYETVSESVIELSRIGLQADKILHYVDTEPDTKMVLDEFELMWSESIPEAEQNGIEEYNLVLIIRNQIKTRTVHDLSVRRLLTDLSITCSLLQSEEMFNDIVILSNLLYNWHRFGK